MIPVVWWRLTTDPEKMHRLESKILDLHVVN
jgi:hypothetical protein